MTNTKHNVSVSTIKRYFQLVSVCIYESFIWEIPTLCVWLLGLPPLLAPLIIIVVAPRLRYIWTFTYDIMKASLTTFSGFILFVLFASCGNLFVFSILYGHTSILGFIWLWHPSCETQHSIKYIQPFYKTCVYQVTFYCITLPLCSSISTILF